MTVVIPVTNMGMVLVMVVVLGLVVLGEHTVNAPRMAGLVLAALVWMELRW